MYLQKDTACVPSECLPGALLVNEIEHPFELSTEQ